MSLAQTRNTNVYLLFIGLHQTNCVCWGADCCDQILAGNLKFNFCGDQFRALFVSLHLLHSLLVCVKFMDLVPVQQTLQRCTDYCTFRIVVFYFWSSNSSFSRHQVRSMDSTVLLVLLYYLWHFFVYFLVTFPFLLIR